MQGRNQSHRGKSEAPLDRVFAELLLPHLHSRTCFASIQVLLLIIMT